jgi:hypothetical protein
VRPLSCAGVCLWLLGTPARALGETADESVEQPLLTIEPAPHASRFWWPTVVFERASTHPRGVRSIDETRFGLALAYRTDHISPHVRALISPSLGAYENLAAMAGAGLRVHFVLGGVSLSYGVGLSIEARLRDSIWLAYAAPVEIGVPIHRGDSAEHYVFVGARRSMAGSLINSYLLDPNGYDNQDSLDQLANLREDDAWQIYVSFAFGRRIE